MAHQFSVEPQALKRRYSVYVVIAEGNGVISLYVGKTGDNREGCNPLISRCGNHFSYNKIPSQVRNKLEAHEDWSYTYVFDHFDEYPEEEDARRTCIDRINEMERWVNSKMQELAKNHKQVSVLNLYVGSGYLKKAEIARRSEFRTEDSKAKVQGIIDGVKAVLDRIC
ncbi:MAG: hypothetical protein P8179_15110 [Candidatus Thiodiazotropha sp.]